MRDFRGNFPNTGGGVWRKCLYLVLDGPGGAGTRDVTNMGIRIRVGTSNSHHRGSQEPNEFTHTYKFVPVKKKAKNILA